MVVTARRELPLPVGDLSADLVPGSPRVHSWIVFRSYQPFQHSSWLWLTHRQTRPRYICSNRPCMRCGLIMSSSHTHTRLTALCPGLPGWAGTRKAKPIWILLNQQTVSGIGISWAICKSAPCSRQITTPTPHHSVFFTGRMPFLPPNQQRQSTEGICPGMLHTHTPV